MVDPTPADPADVTSALTGKGVRLSASALGAFERCARRWWFDKIAGRPRETSPAMAFGSAVHGVLEQHLRGDLRKDFADWPTGRAATLAREGTGHGPDGRPHLPTPGTVHVEAALAGKCGPLPFAGYVDFHPRDEAAAVAYRPDVGGVYIGDHKTTSDPRWAKTPESLAVDTQTHAYAWKLWGPSGLDAGLRHTDKVGLTHVYYVTKGRPRALRVDAVTTWGEVQNTWLERYLPAAVAMARLARVEDPVEVPSNPGDCNAYYRLCPHAAVCSSSPTNVGQRAAKASSLIGL